MDEDTMREATIKLAALHDNENRAYGFTSSQIDRLAKEA